MWRFYGKDYLMTDKERKDGLVWYSQKDRTVWNDGESWEKGLEEYAV